MNVLLPAGIPEGFAVEPATSAHINDAFSLCAAEQTAAFGFCPTTVEDVRSWLEPPTTTMNFQYLVRDADGAPAQWWVLFRDADDPIFHAWISTDPVLPDAVSDELARAGWAWLLNLVRDHLADVADGEPHVHSGCPAGSLPNQRHLAEAGFTFQRTFWEMVGTVTDARCRRPDVPGLMIQATQDVAAVHAVLNEAFTGHYGYTPVNLDNWLAIERSLAGYDPNLWYLATVDDEPAAAMTLSRRLEAEGALYVAELGTLEPFRQRGLAAALLALGFEVAQREGLGQLALHVDSENTHHAPSVYRRAGLEVRTAFLAYARTP